MEIVSVREFARRVGVSHTAIQKAIKIGRIIPTENGKIEFERNISQYGDSAKLQIKSKPKTENVAKKKTIEKNGDIVDQPQSIMENNPKVIQEDKPWQPTEILQNSEKVQNESKTESEKVDNRQEIEGMEYIEARAMREEYLAKIAKLEYETKIGKLISADDVKVIAFNSARRARDMIMSIPDKISPILAGLSNPIEVHQVLGDELRQVCAEISGNF